MEEEVGKKISDLIEEENSRWIFQNIQQISNMLGVTINGLEE